MPFATPIRILVISLYFVICSWLVNSSALAATASPALLKAKREAETTGHIFFSSHNEIVENAKKEAKLRVLSSFDPDVYPHMIKAFKIKYPFIDVSVQELTGSDANENLLLQLKAGAVKGWDVTYLKPDFYNNYIPYIMKFDILGMAKHGILSVPLEMIDPINRAIVAEGSGLTVSAYNKNLISQENVPNRWEDFLKPEFSGRKFVMEIRPVGLLPLVAALSTEWALDYAGKLAAQKPIWVRGQSRGLAAMSAGEYPLFHQVNYHSCIRAMQKDPTGSLVCKVIEPVPVRIFEHEGVLNQATSPHAGLLWLEFQASSTGQKIIDEYEPLKSSIYAPGSALQTVTKGKKLAVHNWDAYHLTPQWMEMIIRAFGLPKAEK